MTQNDGGPAFPRPHSERNEFEEYYGQKGMTLRDWFAGQALSNPDICRRDDEYPQRTAYAFADAILEARNK